jgi:hypothetical protein
MQGYRFCYGLQYTRVFNFQWDIIRNTSFVVITASEGMEGVDVDSRTITYNSASPRKFVGSARMTVDNISPHDGGVTFHVTIDWGSLLMVWIDIIVFDELNFGMDGFPSG